MEKKSPVKSTRKPIRKTVGGLCLPKKANFDLTLLLEAAEIIEINKIRTFYYIDGAKYVGEHINLNPNGHGECTFPDGTVYIGEFSCGKFHGKIEKYSPDNVLVFSGLYNKGERHGDGIIYFTENRRFECSYINGVLDGNAKFFRNDVIKIECNFTNGKVNKVIEYRSNTSVKYHIIDEKIVGDIEIHLHDGTMIKGTEENCYPLPTILQLNNL
jgi:antitoxin component YwqK of YwqJK toxin-antitoxin module